MICLLHVLFLRRKTRRGEFRTRSMWDWRERPRRAGGLR